MSLSQPSTNSCDLSLAAARLSGLGLAFPSTIFLLAFFHLYCTIFYPDPPIHYRISKYFETHILLILA